MRGLAVGLVGMMLLAGCQAKVETPQPVPIVTPKPMPVRSGTAIFTQNCAQCHGILGEGGATMEEGSIPMVRLNDPKPMDAMTDEQIKQAIVHGKGIMPAFGNTFTPDAINALVAHVRSLSKAKTVHDQF